MLLWEKLLVAPEVDRFDPRRFSSDVGVFVPFSLNYEYGGSLSSQSNAVCASISNYCVMGILKKVILLGGYSVGDSLTESELAESGVECSVPCYRELTRLKETDSLNTRENALAAEPLLRSLQARTAVLFAQAYHSRRALWTFRRVMPDIQFRVVPVPDSGRWDDNAKMMLRNPHVFALRELVAIGYFAYKGWI